MLPITLFAAAISCGSQADDDRAVAVGLDEKTKGRARTWVRHSAPWVSFWKWKDLLVRRPPVLGRGTEGLALVVYSVVPYTASCGTLDPVERCCGLCTGCRLVYRGQQ
ncbi:hypothetical protein GGS24DRAFT_503554 [Hypoxylon argillaceum]|nr:hypothetical protein GGS24DRAFT_503554 [Hypoxylon argillaceum]